MEKIGYIIRYDESDEKGVLVYGYNIYKNNPQNRPISFSKTDCVSAVMAGQLVYFNLDDNKATHIERASLGNFKRDIISEIASFYDSDGCNLCKYKSYIAYRPEDLADNSNQNGSIANTRRRRKGNKISLLDDDLDLDFPCNMESFGFSREKWEEGNAKKVDILDLEKWLDERIVKGEHLYGTTAEEVLDLFNLFVKKRRDSYKKYERESLDTHDTKNLPLGMMDDSISPKWELLLASLSKDDLRTIVQKEPMLQPALPSQFCIENLDALSIDYGFPDTDVCEAYYRYRIGIIKMTTEYRFMSDMIYTANHCTIKHKENEGTHPCQIGKEVLQGLTDLLDNQFQTIVLDNIKQKLYSISDKRFDINGRILSLIREGSFSYLQIIGDYVDIYDGITLFDGVIYYCDYFKTIRFAIDTFKSLMKEDQIYLESSIKSKFGECITGIAKEHYYDGKVYQLCSLINDYPQYLTSEDFETIKRSVNSEFAELDDLEELDDAANCGLITQKQHLDRYKELTTDHDIESILGILNDHLYHKNMPTSTQAYLIKQVFDKYKYKTLNSYHYVKVDYDTITNFGDLVGWFNKECKYGYLDAQIFGNILQEIMEGLSKEDRWQLFDKGLVSSPGMDNIREYLNDAYNQNRFENEYYRKECFQDVMCTDILTANGDKLKFMIVDHLDQKHQRGLGDKCDGVIKLYLWVTNPNEKYDWNLITSYLSELPEEKQIRLFRYIFYLIAKKSMEISVDELYKFFVESEKKVCHAVCGMVYLLKEQLSPIGIIKSEKLDEIIGEGFRNIHKFLLVKTFFYPCNGHLALTRMSQDRDYQTYNGYVEKIAVQEKEYYSISFYNTPRDIYGREVDWLDDKDILMAKAVLETNINAKIINGNYIVNVSEEMAIKQFIMAYDIDDHCCLLDPKQALIEKGYLPPNNSYQPLYTNYIRPYDDDSFDTCRCINYIDVDPIDGIPFYWCNKKPCVRRCHYILPLSEWEKYKLSDFIFILLGSETVNLSKVWNMTSRISQFLNSYFESKRSKNESNESSDKEQLNTQNLQINKSDEIGVLTEESSVVQDINDDDEEYDDYGGNFNDSNYYEDDEPTYERYNGSYAQDEMGYSDDDIDTIFDGDPSAYWNID